MKKLLTIFVGILLFSVTSFSQEDNTLFDENSLQSTAAWLGMNITPTAMAGEDITQLGLDLGLTYNNALLVGWQWRKTANEVTLDNNPNINRLDFGYHTIFLGYILKPYKVVHPYVTFGVGPGKITVDDAEDRLFIMQPAVGLEVNVFRWARVGVEGGYRQVSGVETNGLVNDDLSNFYGAITFKFGWSWGKH